MWARETAPRLRAFGGLMVLQRAQVNLLTPTHWLMGFSSKELNSMDTACTRCTCRQAGVHTLVYAHTQIKDFIIFLRKK